MAFFPRASSQRERKRERERERDQSACGGRSFHDFHNIHDMNLMRKRWWESVGSYGGFQSGVGYCFLTVFPNIEFTIYIVCRYTFGLSEEDNEFLIPTFISHFPPYSIFLFFFFIFPNILNIFKPSCAFQFALACLSTRCIELYPYQVNLPQQLLISNCGKVRNFIQLQLIIARMLNQ